MSSKGVAPPNGAATLDRPGGGVEVRIDGGSVTNKKVLVRDGAVGVLSKNTPQKSSKYTTYNKVGSVICFFTIYTSSICVIFQYYINSYNKYIMKLEKFADILKKNETVSQLQTTGGFAIKTLDDTTLSYIQVENVYERLGYLSVNNIVAVSECIKGSDTPNNVVYKMLNKFEKEVKMYGCEEDTGFVVGSNDPSITVSVTSVSSGCSVLNFNDIKIASIHLPGDGPNQKKQTISEFLDENLDKLKDENVDVVCGDTNITDAKSSKKGVDRKKELEDYFKQFFGGPCIVLTSNVRVGKHRRGFVLRNQQLRKSVPESTIDTEADGTIMAIKLNSSKQIDDTVLNELKRLNHSESQSVENALEFKVPSSRCLNEDGIPIEKIWLDHSVLFINIRILCDLIGKECAPNYPRNLIVVNMGSIVNAGFKSWNTKYLPFQSVINIADKDVYEIVRNYNSSKPFPEYENIFGSSMVVDEGLKSKFGNGVDEIEINEPSNEMMDKINERLSELMLVLNPPQRGGNLKNRRKSRFTRRINKNKNKSINKRRIKLLKKISKRLRNKRRSSNFRL